MGTSIFSLVSALLHARCGRQTASGKRCGERRTTGCGLPRDDNELASIKPCPSVSQSISPPHHTLHSLDSLVLQFNTSYTFQHKFTNPRHRTTNSINTAKMQTSQIISLAFALAGYVMAAPAPASTGTASPYGGASAGGSTGTSAGRGDGPLVKGTKNLHYCSDPSNYGFMVNDVEITPKIPMP